MVGEDEDLGLQTEFFEDGEKGAGALVIKGHEEIIEDERDRRVVLQVQVDGGEPKGKVELIGGPFRESAGWDRFSAGPNRDELRGAFVIKLGGHFFKSSSGEGVEKRGGLFHHRALRFLAVVFDLLLQKIDGIVELAEAFGISDDGSKGIRRRLFLRRGEIAGFHHFFLSAEVAIENGAGFVTLALQVFLGLVERDFFCGQFFDVLLLQVGDKGIERAASGEVLQRGFLPGESGCECFAGFNPDDD